jgi:pentatricopeptide repeat protein
MDAKSFFDQMPTCKDFLCTEVIVGYVKHGFAKDGLTLFYHMQQTSIQPDQFTFINVFPTCAKFGPLEQGMSLHEEITRNGFQLGLLATMH